MKNRINVYVFTRPLQYANVKNIIAQNKTNTNILFVYPNFTDGYVFYKKILEFEKEWDQVIYIDSRFKLFKELIKRKVNNLYLSTDLGFYALTQIFTKNSFHYEEGWGTYNKGEKKKLTLKTKMLLLFYKLIGSGNHIGNSSRTNGVIVYNKKLHQLKFPEYKKELFNFPLDFKNNIQKNLPFFESVYNFKNRINDCVDKSILIYASGWKIDEEILKEFEKSEIKYDRIFVKLHPHIKNTASKIRNYELLEQNVLLEIYISELLKQRNTITVWHDNSSSVFYYLDEIEVKNIGRSRPEYDEILNFIKKEV